MAIPDGEPVQLTLLQHMGLQTRNMKLKAKLLTCPAKFARANNLKERGLTETGPRGQHCHRPQAKPLAVILGMDCMHWAPVLIDQYQDNHGFLALYACKLSNMAIMQGNRQFPYTPEEAQNALAATSSIEDQEVGDDDLPLTTIFHGATSDDSVQPQITDPAVLRPHR